MKAVMMILALVASCPRPFVPANQPVILASKRRK